MNGTFYNNNERKYANKGNKKKTNQPTKKPQS